MSSTRISVDRAGIERVIRLASPVSEPLRAGGFAAFVVGGFVRDLLVGRGYSDDIDMTTNALPGAIKKLIAPIADDVWLQGERFGTIGCRIHGTDFEITTHRAERYDKTSRKPLVEFASAIETDLSRRDFTVNAIAISMPGGELVDPFGGADDLSNRLLRTPTDSAASFSDDPLRILRAARFQAGYGLNPVEELVAAAAQLVDRLEIVSKERIRVELDKLLVTPNPTRGFEFISTVEAWPWILPQLHRVDRNSELAAIATVSSTDTGTQLLARRALLFRSCRPPDRAAELKTLRYSNTEQHRTMAVARGLDIVANRDAQSLEVDASTIRQILAIVRDDWPAVVSGAGAIGSGLGTVLEAGWQRLAATEDLTQLGPGLTAAEVMSALGVEPGPIVGAANSELTRIRIEEGRLPKDRLRQRLCEWFDNRPSGT